MSVARVARALRTIVVERSRQALLYAAYGIVVTLTILGLSTWAWLWQVRDWGITAERQGDVFRVQTGSVAEQAGITVDDRISPSDLQRLQVL